MGLGEEEVKALLLEERLRPRALPLVVLSWS